MAKSLLAEQPQDKPIILIVEDNPSDAFIIGDLLAGHTGDGYEARHVRTQGEAILALGEETFDACLLDLTLPDATGFSALIDIQEKAPDMPVLILTGLNDASLAKRAVGRGAQDYLLKDELETGMLGRSIEYARERKHIEKELFRRANYDPLTGLANRSLLEARLKMALARAERSGYGLALLFVDLDRFKHVNDAYGHEAGDTVLKAVAQRIRGVLRAYDTAARFGGDEFAVLLENIATSRDAAIIAQKIIAALAPSVAFQGHALATGASIGIAFSDDPERAETMMQNADAAMYRAKEEGGGTYRFYAPDIHHKAELRLKTEEELRLAFFAGQLRLYYQPYVLPNGGAVLGVETLLRWAHPGRGMLCPGEFLALAEECRMMPDIGKWTFSTLARDIIAWNAQGVPPLEIAFNLCASQLDAPGFFHWITPLMEREVLSHHRFVAEIDCDALTALSESRFLIFAQLREMGILLHLDHFGQGPVSLQTLHTYPFSLLKLNLATIEQMNRGGQADAMIQTAIELAHQLGMKAGAVGVETQSQMQMLMSQRCDTVQGFLIGRPMTAEELPAWLAKKR